MALMCEECKVTLNKDNRCSNCESNTVIERLEGLRNVTKELHDEQLKKVKQAFKESGRSYETVAEYGDRVANEAIVELLDGIIEMLNEENN